MTIPYKSDPMMWGNYQRDWQQWLAMLPPQAALQAVAPRYYAYPGEPVHHYDLMQIGDLYIDATVKPLGMIAREIADERKEMVGADLWGPNG